MLKPGIEISGNLSAGIANNVTTHRRSAKPVEAGVEEAGAVTAKAGGTRAGAAKATAKAGVTGDAKTAGTHR